MAGVHAQCACISTIYPGQVVLAAEKELEPEQFGKIVEALASGQLNPGMLLVAKNEPHTWIRLISGTYPYSV